MENLGGYKRAMDRCLYYIAHDAWARFSGYQIDHASACLTFRGSRTSDNLDELAGNDGLTSAVVQNLELVDHVAGVLGGVVHGVLTRRDLASVALGKCLVLLVCMMER